MAPGGNIGDRCAIFEATHGSAPKYAGLDKVNPSSLILSGVEMLKFIGWNEAADLIIKAIVKTIQFDPSQKKRPMRVVAFMSGTGTSIRKLIGEIGRYFQEQ